MDLVAPPVVVPGGERVKIELHFVEDMQRRVIEHRIDRHSYVIAVGGGALLDAAGLDALGMVREGQELAKINPKNIVIKVPMTPEGLKATSIFTAGLKT